MKLRKIDKHFRIKIDYYNHIKRFNIINDNNIYYCGITLRKIYHKKYNKDVFRSKATNILRSFIICLNKKYCKRILRRL
jgi:hypothetical protein